MIKMQLIVVQGKPEGKTIPLMGPVFVIGREEGCHLRPSSDEVSRRHSEIRIGAEGATVSDLGSRNGTFVNGRRVTEPTPLKSGDLVKVGPLTFAVSIQGAPGAAAPAKPSSGVKSLDEVGHEEVASWLIADDKQPLPDRPSAVYKGETISISAYKEGAAKKAAEPAPLAATQSAELPQVAPTPPPADTRPVPAAAAKPAPAPAAKPTPAPAPKPAPAPAAPPAPAAAAPPAPATAAPPAPAAAAPPAAPEPPPAPAPPPPQPAVEARPAPSPPPTKVGAPPKSIWDELDFIEQLPEGQGDAEAEAEAAPADGETEEAAAAASGEMPEEWVDESNPFYAAKKKGAAGNQPEKGPAEPAKASFKDSSEAANAILKKMLERRKGGG
jgi:hypothetical protein